MACLYAGLYSELSLAENDKVCGILNRQSGSTLKELYVCVCVLSLWSVGVPLLF